MEAMPVETQRREGELEEKERERRGGRGERRGDARVKGHPYSLNFLARTQRDSDLQSSFHWGRGGEERRSGNSFIFRPSPPDRLSMSRAWRVHTWSDNFQNNSSNRGLFENFLKRD